MSSAILKNISSQFPQAAFGALRKHDVHTGVDIYKPVGEAVYALKDSVFVNCEIFTGEEVGFPWWHTTWSVTLKDETGYTIYGEIKPSLEMDLAREQGMENIVSRIPKGTFLGTVIQVLKKDKGKPMSMLHLERYGLGALTNKVTAVIQSVYAGPWELDGQKPQGILDPADEFTDEEIESLFKPTVDL